MLDSYIIQIFRSYTVITQISVGITICFLIAADNEMENVLRQNGSNEK